MTEEVAYPSADLGSVSSGRRVAAVLSALAMLLMSFGMLAVGSPAADAASDTCTPGLHSPKIGNAQHDYHYACGLYWDSRSGEHRCDWSSKGWLCSGPRNERLQDRTTCYTNEQLKPKLSQAKERYEKLCGMDWDADSGRHRCDYSSFGWSCVGPSKR